MLRPYQRFRIGRRVANTGASLFAKVNPTRQFLSPDRSQPSPTSQPTTRPSSRDHSVGRLSTVVFPKPSFPGLNQEFVLARHQVLDGNPAGSRQDLVIRGRGEFES